MPTVLQADYSAALTLLLRYPIPLSPHGPPSFVGDALYLRDNLLLDGGDHIISKYSRRAPETTVTRKLPRKIKRARTAEQEAAQLAVPAKTTHARIFQDQGSIERLVHEAAKGVYSQGEKWGVGKALRGAVQGLQSGNISPRRISDWSQRSIDEETNNPRKSDGVPATIEVLEQRSNSLAKLLGSAVAELWTQQQEIHQTNNEAATEGLSLAIAKVQFVQVYLENSTMPLPSDASPEGEIKDNDGGSGAEQKKAEAPRNSDPEGASANEDGPADEKITSIESHEASLVSTEGSSMTHKLATQPTTGGGIPPKSPSPLPRPSLDKSPFSWMLGDDERKSEFIAPSTGGSEKTQGRSGNLFGSTGSNGRIRGHRIIPKEKINQGKDDVFGT